MASGNINGVSFSERGIISAFTNLISGEAEQRSAGTSSWLRLSSELERLVNRLDELQTLAAQADEYLSVNADRAKTASAMGVDLQSYTRGFDGSIESLTAGVFDDGS